MRLKPSGSALLTDLYQLTMLDVYFRSGMRETAVFEFFVRRLPSRRHFLIAAGLEQALEYLHQLHFTESEIAWLRDSRRFGDAFIDSLHRFRFTGDVFAMPEGTVFFADEPVLRVVAPLPEAQLIESRLINLLHYQTLIASKAVRCVLAAGGRTLVDFGMRRAHGAESALLSSRASYLAGFTGTATVLSGAVFGIPLYGTMAHSFVQAHEDEVQAFENFARAFPDNAVLLIDTYDTAQGARRAAAVAERLASDGIEIRAVRIDSGDLAAEARQVRQILDRAGHPRIDIFASGNLDEHRVAALVSDGAPIDGFGVGTNLDISEDAPSLDCVYKLQEYADLARRKRSAGKVTWPGRKQVFRQFDGAAMQSDVVGLTGDDPPGTPLLVPVMQKGKRLAPPEPMLQIRERVSGQLAALPDRLRSLDPAEPYRVDFSSALKALARSVDRSTA